MKYWDSSETFADVGLIIAAVRHCFNIYFQPFLDKPPLAELDLELRYVPITMPESYLERYPERSKIRLKQKLYDCAPQLNYEIFEKGSWEQQLTEYVRGIKLSLPHLHRLGAKQVHIETLEKLLDDAPKEIMKVVTDPNTIVYENGRKAMESPTPWVNRPSPELLKLLGFE